MGTKPDCYLPAITACLWLSFGINLGRASVSPRIITYLGMQTSHQLLPSPLRYNHISYLDPSISLASIRDARADRSIIHTNSSHDA